MVWFGLVWFGLVLFGLVWFGLVWFGLVWLGDVWFRLLGRLLLLLSRTQFLFAFPFPYSSSSITTVVSCTIPGIYRYYETGKVGPGWVSYLIIGVSYTCDDSVYYFRVNLAT